jgi:ABC-2 type transport system permease protein
VNFQQLKTILWLRWRLTRNQWSRSGGLGAVIAAVVAVAILVLGGVSFVGAWLGGMFGLHEAKPMVIMGVWFGITAGFLFLWMIGLINELQRSESIDLQRLMHLPVALGQMFVVNYLASHLAFSIILLVPAMMGLTGGLAFSRGPVMLLLAPLALSMVFMVTAWTYLLRGWLATLMANPRRRRAVIMGITFAFIVIAQGPNLYFNLIRGEGRQSKPAASQELQDPTGRKKSADEEKLKKLIAAQKFVPPLWVPAGAGALAEGRPLPALLGTLGCLALGVVGLRRAYRSTVRFYHGETGKRAGAQSKPDRVKAGPETPAKAGSRFLELRLPAVPEQAAALALATFRSMARAPEVKMAWGSSFLVTLIFGASFLLRAPPSMSETAKPFIASGAVMFSIFMLVQFFANQFGFDRDGFRAVILSPAPRRLILLGKNLACLPAGGGFGVMLLVLLAIWLRLPPLVFLAALLQLATLLLLAGLVGNLLSILAPYRIQPGSMKPTKMPGLAMLLMVACHLLFPVAMLPVLVPPLGELLWQMAGWPSAVPVNLLLSVALTALMGFVYWQTLAPLGRLLQRRETKILSVVTVEVE